jgi:predicted transcriptional regulator
MTMTAMTSNQMTSNQKLEQKLQQLSLTTMSRHIEQALSDAAQKNWSPATMLEWLADVELGAPA